MGKGFAETVNIIRLMCNTHDDCKECPLKTGTMCTLDMVFKGTMDYSDARKYIRLIEKTAAIWRIEHPDRTIKDVVKEFFPGVQTEKFCPILLVPTWPRHDASCVFAPNKQKCVKCWNTCISQLDDYVKQYIRIDKKAK